MLRTAIFTVFILCAGLTSAQNTLSVEITNLRSNKGLVSLELLDENKNNVDGKTESIRDNKCIITFTGLKEQKYAIRYFHDENVNKKVDKNKIGIPKEGYGFSNDAYGTFGPEDFKKWLFDVKGNTQIKLSTTYYF